MNRLTKLILNNVGTIHDAELPLDKQGVVLFTGENRVTKGNNGAGKSTPWNALDFLLNGSTKTSKPTTFINLHRKTFGMMMGLEWRQDGHDFFARRAWANPKYGTGLKLFEDSKDISMKGPPKRVEQQIEEMWGISRQEYRNTIHLSGDFTHLLLKGTPTERDYYLTKLFQLDVYDRMLMAAKEDLDGLRSVLGESDELVYRYKSVKKDLAALPAPNPEKIEELTKRFDSAHRVISSLNRKQTKLVRQAEGYRQRQKIAKQIDDLGDSDFKLKLVFRKYDDLGKMRDRLHRYESDLRKAEKAAIYRKQRKALLHKLDKLPDSKESRRSLHKKVEALDAKQRRYESLVLSASDAKQLRRRVRSLAETLVERARSTADIPSAERDSLPRQLAKVQSRSGDLRDRIAKLRSLGKGSCPTCGTEIKDPERIVRHLKEEAERLERKEKSLAKAVEAIEDVKDLQDKILDYKKRLKDLPDEDPSQIKKKARKLAKLVASLRDELRNAERRVEIEEQLADLRDIDPDLPDVDFLKKKLADFRTEYEKAKTYHDLYSLLEGLPTSAPSKHKIEKYQRKIKAASEETRNLQRRIDSLEEAQKAYDSKRYEYCKLRERLVKIKSKRIEEEALNGLVTAFGRKGLRLAAQRRIISVITKVLPEYLEELFNERITIKITEKETAFDLELYRGKDQIPPEQFSKGERARLSLALLLATRRATPVRKHTNILVIDEVLDAIDTEGYEGVIRTMRNLLDTTGVTSCFLISQNTEVAKSKKFRALFDQVWTAVKSRSDKTEIQT